MIRRLAKDVVCKLKDITKIEFSERSHQVEIIGKYNGKPVIVTLQMKDYTPREKYGDAGEPVKGIRKRKIKNKDRQWVTIEETVNRYSLSEAEKKFIYDAYVKKHLDQRQIHRVSGIPQPYIYRYIKHMKMTPVYPKTIRSERNVEMTMDELFQYYNLNSSNVDIEYVDDKVKDHHQIPCVSADEIEDDELDAELKKKTEKLQHETVEKAHITGLILNITNLKNKPHYRMEIYGKPIKNIHQCIDMATDIIYENKNFSDIKIGKLYALIRECDDYLEKRSAGDFIIIEFPKNGYRDSVLEQLNLNIPVKWRVSLIEQRQYQLKQIDADTKIATVPLTPIEHAPKNISHINQNISHTRLDLYDQLYMQDSSLFEECYINGDVNTHKHSYAWFDHIQKAVLTAIHCYNTGKFGYMSIFSDECIYMVTDILYTNFILDKMVGEEGKRYQIIPLCIKCGEYIDKANTVSTITTISKSNDQRFLNDIMVVVPMPWRHLSKNKIENISVDIQDDFAGDVLNTISYNKPINFTKPFKLDPYPTRSEWKARRKDLGLKNGEDWRNSDIDSNPGKKIQGSGKTATKRKKAKNARKEERRKKNIEKFNKNQPTRYNVDTYKQAGYFDEQNKRSAQHNQTLKNSEK